MIKKAIFLLALSSMAMPLIAQNRQGGCVKVVVGSEQKNKGSFDQIFSATKILDIDFGVVFTQGAANRFSDQHLVEFRIFNPNGNLYQSMAVPFTASESHKGELASVDGYPYPVAVQLMKPVTLDGKNHLETWGRIPVAGSSIMNSSMYGLWSIQAFVDGESLPCAANATFEIRP